MTRVGGTSNIRFRIIAIQAWQLVRVRRLLKDNSLSAVMDRMTMHREASGRSSDRPASVNEVVWANKIAAAFLPGRYRCLERSLVLYSTLITLGYVPTLRIGATVHGFRAHAWVEIDGQPINDVPDLVREFKTFPLPRNA